MYAHPLLWAAHFLVCAILFHSLLFHYALMPGTTHYTEFMTHKWVTTSLWEMCPGIAELLKVTISPGLLDQSLCSFQ